MMDEQEAEWLMHMAFNGQKVVPDDIRKSLQEKNLIDRRIGGDIVTDAGWVALITHDAGGNKDISQARRGWKIRRRDILRQ